MDMKDKVCVVTGATDGIGRATAADLAERGATVVVVGRDQAKIERTVGELRQRSRTSDVEGIRIDLSSLEQVRAGAEEIRSRHPHLHALVNNAAVVTPRREVSEDGFELQLAVNFLAPFLLTNLLLAPLQAGGGRIVNVSSTSHRKGRIDFDDLQCAAHYEARPAYYRTRLALVLFTYGMARRLRGGNVTSNCLHPGIVQTKLSHDYMGNPVLRLFEGMVAVSPEKAARTSLHLVTSDEVAADSGRFFVRGRAVPSAPATYDTGLQDRLWQTGAALVGLRGPGEEAV